MATLHCTTTVRPHNCSTADAVTRACTSHRPLSPPVGYKACGCACGTRTRACCPWLPTTHVRAWRRIGPDYTLQLTDWLPEPHYPHCHTACVACMAPGLGWLDTSRRPAAPAVCCRQQRAPSVAGGGVHRYEPYDASRAPRACYLPPPPPRHRPAPSRGQGAHTGCRHVLGRACTPRHMIHHDGHERTKAPTQVGESSNR